MLLIGVLICVIFEAGRRKKMQNLEQGKEFGSRVSLHKNGSSSSSLASVAPFLFLLIDSFTRKSFSYNKLPQEPLHLTVIKLDGSFFDIEVAKMAMVAELKQAVEAAFSHLPRKGIVKVSWSHVWGQFCLCYNGQKLLCDTDYIGMYGIQEGDKLHFIWHTSVYYNLVKTRSEKEDVDSEQPSISSSIRDFYQERAKKDRDDYCSELKKYKSRERKKATDVYCSEQEKFRQDNEDDCITTDYEYKFAGLLRGWFSYRRLANSETSCEESPSSSPSKLNHGFFNISKIWYGFTVAKIILGWRLGMVNNFWLVKSTWVPYIKHLSIHNS